MISLVSATFPLKALEAARGLVLSFFPRAAIRVGVAARADGRPLGDGFVIEAGLGTEVSALLSGALAQAEDGSAGRGPEKRPAAGAPFDKGSAYAEDGGVGRDLGKRPPERLERGSDSAGEESSERRLGETGLGLTPWSGGKPWFDRKPWSEGVATDNVEGVWAVWRPHSALISGSGAESADSAPSAPYALSALSAPSAPPALSVPPAPAWAELSPAELREMLRQPRGGRETLVSMALKLVLLRLLSTVTGKELPWGILTGIRPTKLVHRLREQGVGKDGQMRVLGTLYAVRPDKTELLQRIAAVQAPYLDRFKLHPERVGIYLGIPFCPSRCSYCSFPGYAADREGIWVEEYLGVLTAEIEAAGQLMRALGLEGEALYFGGGTPGILTEKQITGLLATCRAHLPLRKDLEFSFEAGRPDTLSSEKLELLAELGATRLSINPQSMQDKTLRRIGRAHDVRSVAEAYRLAREIAPWVINMDIILGLPGEGVEEVGSTLRQLAELRPDNLTVHALALKRGARETEHGYEHPENSPVLRMQALARESTCSWGLRPYYLYRQKRTAGNSENIGYARPGTESRYNIAIMEERQSIIGLGAGASTKAVNPSDYSLINLQHPSNWQVYMKAWPQLQEKRARELAKIFRREEEKG
ncbi:coproporphyrinogen dehydrogenase HemZ [Acididesulfobacillus acetoxydans]|uniref:Coproporphyrinogen dehydrogenase HemZ n=1 Tax=Acididesulfobacillus acetoxydans TaxID=1561005 RepID=A0A8S0X5J4_9FIRM|nr:coproporphyrinogen dehydrogenase HemZ [Acididesulfobacillus acetoxydans]CAA7601710.1 coproporphyrinogen dehydrogenase HemZ [Acididesulfobacillus acetoxydans]CEJ09071.1 Oxygen-independent coproporphyrinogen-III oxidase 2 [Acididesulfobacillus acetoxydans]